jgi:VPDSG-CTERM motif
LYWKLTGLSAKIASLVVSMGLISFLNRAADAATPRIAGRIIVPQGYVSGVAISNTMTFNNETLASLGLTPGTYIWSWGTGLPNQNFTLIIGGAGVPDGGTTISLLGFGLLGLAALRRKFSC